MREQAITIEIGGHPILLRTKDDYFRQLVADRYAGFISSSQAASFEFDVDVLSTPPKPSDQDVLVERRGAIWRMQRGDFLAQWDSTRGRGHIQQTANPYSIDSVLRIVHSLILAREGGFLLHAASVIRNGHAFLFAGVSGAGKTTISRLAPGDATLLTDEISYVRRECGNYYACGTPFSGELQRSGENCAAPVRSLFFLEHGPENKIEPMSQPAALRRLLRNTLFFAEDEELVKRIFQAAGEFLDRVPAQGLTFLPDPRVWSMIQ
ncbi:MAG TPA: hypothetical protein VLW84_13775 [Terriglobales bacterium]|nr:hypothetical protein [Terriglobales bacterium]